MSFTDFWSWLENVPLAQRIGESAWFPFVESVHVVAVVFVFGSLLMVDLRLLNLAARQYAPSSLARELTPWTWGAFGLALMTGVGMFITRASSYLDNRAMQIKLILLLIAGINMALFHKNVFRRIESWDKAAAPPMAAKIAGAASLLIWSGVMLAGRWIGHLV